ncbi:MAG: hypothetical protein FD174_2477 [Geobacteraceae bacterium]|nr:MAG: hypothetical protein FD174_2477 [Geobacteraceae bacterium]
MRGKETGWVAGILRITALFGNVPSAANRRTPIIGLINSLIERFPARNMRYIWNA